MTHDNKYLLVADQGMDHVNVYRLDLQMGKVMLADIIRSELESAPRHIKISKDGRFIYIVHECKCFIDVYSYEDKKNQPVFEKIQSVKTCNTEMGSYNAASALTFSDDHKYLLSSNAGDNSVVLYEVNEENGHLSEVFSLPVGGEYPKDASLFPNNKFLVSLNHETNDMTFFRVNTEKGNMIMNGPPIKVDVPNCITFHRL